MADPICRWRNSSLKQLNEFNLLFPLAPINKDEGRKIVEDNWTMLGGNDFFTTPYQLAAQMGVYYENDSLMIPRFNKLINLRESNAYMQNWGRKYYAPNPYTKSMQQSTRSVVINRFLVNWVKEKGEGSSFSEALRGMFPDSIGNTDIITNMINNFMDVRIEGDKIYLKNQEQQKFAENEIFINVSPNDKKAFFDFVGDSANGPKPILIINEKKLTLFILSAIKYFDTKDHLNAIVPYAGSSSPIKVSKENSFSLVGMFIETTLEDVKARNITHQRWFEDEFKLGEREVFLSTQWNAQGNYQLTLPDFMEMVKVCYGDNYFYKLGPNGEHQLYFVEERNDDKFEQTALQQIFYGAPGTGKSFEINHLTKDKEVIRTTFHPDSDYSTFVGAYKPTSIEVPVRDVTGKVIVENGKPVTENRIVYEFVQQAFLQAYTKAWSAYANKADGEKPEEQYLVIEEINRGNCAQIFGDLFQLLDRNAYGFSDYPITADKDMKKQLAKAFNGLAIADAGRINGIYEKDVVSKVLSGDILLLPDNLFIWATMNTSDQSLFPIDSAFKRRWDWKYVPISEGVDESGKKLGYRIEVRGKQYDWWTFIEKINDEIGEQTKSEDKKLGYFFCKAKNGIIDAETFVGKVVFYLWNDVFKDQDVANIFSDGDEELTFGKFYGTDTMGKAFVKEDKVEVLLRNLGLEPLSAAEEPGDDVSPSSELLVKYKGVTIEGTSSISKYIEIINRVVSEKGEALVAKCLGADLTQTPADNTRNFKEIGNTGWYLATNFGTAKIKENLNKVEASLGVGIVIE